MYSLLFLVSGFLVLAVANVGFRATDRVVAPFKVDPAIAPSVRDPLVGVRIETPGDRLAAVSVLALLLTFLVSIALGWVVAGRALRPLQAITARARAISASNLHERLGIVGPEDEFTELGATLDDLLGRLEASFDSQRHFVANASHELRTPLTAERTLLQVALADPDASAASLRATCEEVLALGAQQERLIAALLTLAMGERGIEERESFDLATIAEVVVSARRALAVERGVAFDTALGDAPALGDPRLVESLITNLVDNALRHNLPDSASGARVEVWTGRVGDRSVLRVGNTGPAVPAEELERVFEPFQRLTDERVGHGAGHGLGLAIVGAIADAHGATVAARPRLSGGLDVEVAFGP